MSRSNRIPLALFGSIILILIVFGVWCVHSGSERNAADETIETKAPAAGVIVRSSRRNSEHTHQSVQSTESDTPALDVVDAKEDLLSETIDKAVDDLSIYPDLGKTPFTEIESSNLMEMLKACPTKNAETVDNEILQQFYETVQRELWAYKTGDGKAILENRLKADYTIDEDSLKRARYHPNMMSDWPVDLPQDKIPTKPDDIMRQSVIDYMGEENGLAYSDLYGALAPTASLFAFGKSTGASPPRSIREEFESNLSMGMIGPPDRSSNRISAAHIGPMVIYTNSIVRVMEEHGSLIYADVRLAVSERNGIKHYRLKRYYWSPNDKAWLSSELTTLSSGDFMDRLEFY